MKKFIVGFLVGALLFSFIGVFAYNIYENPYKIMVNDVEKQIQGYNVDDYSYFKLRDIADAVGGFDVDFQNDTIQISSNNRFASPEEIEEGKHDSQNYEKLIGDWYIYDEKRDHHLEIFADGGIKIDGYKYGLFGVYEVVDGGSLEVIFNQNSIVPDGSYGFVDTDDLEAMCTYDKNNNSVIVNFKQDVSKFNLSNPAIFTKDLSENTENYNGIEWIENSELENLYGITFDFPNTGMSGIPGFYKYSPGLISAHIGRIVYEVPDFNETDIQSNIVVFSGIKMRRDSKVVGIGTDTFIVSGDLEFSKQDLINKGIIK